MKRLIALVLLVPMGAGAYPITFDFSANITSAPGADLLSEFTGIGLPSTVTGSYQFDSDATYVPGIDDPGRGTPDDYYSFLEAFSITINGETFTEVAPGIGTLSLANDRNFQGACCPQDFYRINTGANLENAAGSRIGVQLQLSEYVDLRFETGLPDGLTSGALPLTPPDPGAFDATLFRVFVGPQIALQGTVSSITLGDEDDDDIGDPVSVPAPGTLALLGLGLPLLALGRRGRRRPGSIRE